MIIFKKSNAFSLIELMVIMLIFTVLLAVFAPVMTKKKTFDRDQPWRWQNNGVGAYFGTADANKISIGTKEAFGRLTIENDSSSNPHLIFLDSSNAKVAHFNTINGTNYFMNSDLPALMSGVHNTVFGLQSSELSTTGNYNTVLGYKALLENQTGSNNTVVGRGAAYSGEDNNDNVYLGYASGNYILSSSASVGVGYLALYQKEQPENVVAVGAGSLTFNSESGSRNTAIGYGALTKSTDDVSDNISFGSANSQYLQSGENNVAVGTSAFASPSTGSNNVFVGVGTGRIGDNITENVGIGAGPLNNLTNGSKNTAIGSHALIDITSGVQNAGFGAYSVHKTVAGNYNSGVGYRALFSNSNGHNSSALGSEACHSSSEVDSTLHNHICIGSGSDPDVIISGEQLYLGSVNTGEIATYVEEITPYSDKRLKKVKENYKTGLEQIRGVVPKYFTYKADKDKKVRLGVIAQDVKKTIPEAIEQDDKGNLLVQGGYIRYALVNAVKELDSIVQNVVNRLKTLVKKVFDLCKRIETLENDQNHINEDLQKINERLKELEADD